MALPISPPWVDSSKGPNRVNRAHWPTKEHRQFFFGPWKKWPGMAPNGTLEVFFRLIQTLPTFWDRLDLDFENVYVFASLDPTFLDFQVPRSPNSQISRSPDFQTPPAAAPDELSDPNLTPLPTHPGIKYVARALAATRSRAVDQMAYLMCF